MELAQAREDSGSISESEPLRWEDVVNDLCIAVRDSCKGVGEDGDPVWPEF
jgi:hypothetical protein